MSHPRFERLQTWRVALGDPAVEIDFSLSGLERGHLDVLAPAFAKAMEAMAALEGGAIANPDEERMVGHYWLRAPGLAPDAETSDAISRTIGEVEAFAAKVHAGEVAPAGGGRFRHVLVVGIGGSALGPMLAADAFASADAPMTVDVLDNTDPDGIDRTLARLGNLAEVLCVVVSKSGGTPETRNGMLEVAAACAAQGLSFAAQAVAVTSDGSALAKRASDEGWLATFPMWDWVGGRTSQLSAVGLLPAALQGMDIRALLAGAAAMDEATRNPDVAANPAALLATFWHAEGAGLGDRQMVVLPYKDRLLLFSRYLQQLVMESLGKKLDRQGREVHQGLGVFGNKGSTDQHAFVQQLRDGRHDFFCVFVRVLRDRAGASIEVEDAVTAGDFLDGFLLGTREALAEEGRHSATITLDQLDERSFGALLALFERTVGIYAELIDINAYHQPGVEAGKKAAARVLDLQRQVQGALTAEPGTCVEIAERAGVDAGDAWPVLRHLAANRDDVRIVGAPDPATARFARA